MLTDKSPMPFGKYKDRLMANVPANYLLWLFENGKCNVAVKEYIQANKEVLEWQNKQSKGRGSSKSNNN